MMKAVGKGEMRVHDSEYLKTLVQTWVLHGFTLKSKKMLLFVGLH